MIDQNTLLVDLVRLAEFKALCDRAYLHHDQGGVSQELMNTINGKQDQIADLGDIRSGAEKGSTALQPADVSPISTAIASLNERVLAVVADLTTSHRVNAAAVADLNARILANTSSIANLDRPTGSTRTGIASIPVTDDVVVATISASASFSLAAVPAAGLSIHVIIVNDSASTVVVTIPNSGHYRNCGPDTINILAGKACDVSVVSDGSIAYLRATAQS